MNSGIDHLVLPNNRVFCGNRRAQRGMNAEAFRALLAAPQAPVKCSGGMLGLRVCARCAAKLAESDARKAAKAAAANV